LQIGMPATVEHRVVRLDEQPSAVSVAECVHNYIGLIDTLKLNMANLLLLPLRAASRYIFRWIDCDWQLLHDP